MPKSILKDKWIVGNEEDGCNIWGLSRFPYNFSYVLPKYSKTVPLYCAMDYAGEHIRLLVPAKHWERVGKIIFRRVVKKPKYFSKIKNEVTKISQKVYHFSEHVLKTDVKKISDAVLVKLFDDHTKIINEMIGWGMVSTVTELPHALFTQYAENFLGKRVEKLHLLRSVADYFRVLSVIETDGAQRQEYLGLLELLKNLQNKGIDGKISKLSPTKAKTLIQQNKALWKKIRHHTEKYSWVYYNYNGPAFNESRTISELLEMIKSKKNSVAELATIKKEKVNQPKNIDQAQRELHLDSREKQLFQAFRDTLTMKLVRRDALTYSFYALEKAVKEFAKRAGITLLQTRSIIIGQHGQVLKHPKKWSKRLTEQGKYCVYVCLDRPTILTGQKARAWVNKMYKEESVTGIKELKGQVACLGFAKGKVKVINLPQEMRKMNKGDILVAIATIPEIVPAMKKAAAIVTEQGGITSHAAIVSRELGIPCIIGTKFATKVLKDGMTVEVDANRGIVRIIR